MSHEASTEAGAQAPFPEGESSALAVTCPEARCRSRIWIGESQLTRRSRRSGSGCRGEASCSRCGCRIHVEMSGSGKITVTKEQGRPCN